MKPIFERTLNSHLGKDPETGTDMEFYDWITNHDPEKALGEFAAALFEDLKECDAEEIRHLLQDWKERLDEAEFVNRLAALEHFLPAKHPYHAIKKSFLTGTR